MGQAVTKIPNDFCRNSDFGIENALAKIARRRWPTNSLDHIASEWGLTTGEARGVLYASASRSTLNKIMKHRRGGLGLWLEVVAEVTGERLDTYITRQAEEARRERAAAEDRERHLSSLEARWRSRVAHDPSGPR